MTKKIKAYAYQGQHEDERGMPGIGRVKKGAVITPIDETHAKRMAESPSFKETSVPAPAAPADEPNTEPQKEKQT